VKYAWDARGSGFASTVSEEGWILFNERLTKARAIYEEEIKNSNVSPNPHFYDWSRSLALGQNWSNHKFYKELCVPVIEQYPWYFKNLKFISHLLPQWGGRLGDPIRLFNQVANDLPEQYADEYYARCFLTSANCFEIVPSLIDFERLKRGVLNIFEKEFGSSYLITNALCFLNTYDTKTSPADLYKRFKTAHPNLSSDYEKESTYLRHFNQSLSSDKNETITRTHIFSPMETWRFKFNQRNQNIVYLKDHNELLVTRSYRGVSFLNPYTGYVFSNLHDSDYWAFRSTVSPSQNLLAVEWVKKGDENQKSHVSIYDISDGEFSFINTFSLQPKEYISSMAFTPDDTGLFIASKNTNNNQTYLSLLESLQDGTPKIVYKSSEKLYRSKLFFSKDGNTLFYLNNKLLSYNWRDQNASIAKHSTKKEKNQPPFIDAQLFGDGKYLAALSFSKKHPTSLSIYDVATTTLLEKVILDVPNVSEKQSIFEIQATNKPNSWNIVSIDSNYSLALWNLERLNKSFKINLTERHLTNRHSVYAMCSKNSTEPAPIWVADSHGLISIWQDSDNVQLEMQSERRHTSNKPDARTPILDFLRKLKQR